MKLNRVRSSPFHRIGNRYGNFFDFDHFMGRSAFEEPWMTKSPMNVKKSKQGYALELAMPGFKSNEIYLSIENDQLTINAEKSRKCDDYIHMDISEKFDEQIFDLSAYVDQQAVSATLEDGMLKITMPNKSNGKHVQHRSIKVA